MPGLLTSTPQKINLIEKENNQHKKTAKKRIHFDNTDNNNNNVMDLQDKPLDKGDFIPVSYGIQYFVAQIIESKLNEYKCNFYRFLFNLY